MTLTLDLTPEEEARLRTAAASQGLPVETCLRHLITTLPETPQSESGGGSLYAPEETDSESRQPWGARVMAELRAEGVVGLFKDRPEDSPELARKFQEEAQRPGPHPCS